MFKCPSCDENMRGLQKGLLFSVGDARFFPGGRQSVFQRRNQKIYSQTYV
jgi:hypothetical protein